MKLFENSNYELIRGKFSSFKLQDNTCLYMTVRRREKTNLSFVYLMITGFGSTTHYTIRTNGIHYDCGCVLTQNGDLIRFQNEGNENVMNVPAVYTVYFSTFGAMVSFSIVVVCFFSIYRYLGLVFTLVQKVCSKFTRSHPSAKCRCR
jgi:hypothetical protein